LRLVEPLEKFVPPATVLDKPFYSPFHATNLAQSLRERGCDSLVISGAETDMCVLAAVLDAVDLGLRVVIPTDALCSSSDEKHEALLALYRDRFSQQIETADAATILACWI
jgi:nicotinamidase-related amidase